MSRHVMKLHPWDEIIASAHEQLAKGHTVFQQFNCEKCGQKLTMDEPNKFHETGTCDRCGHLTDIKKNGMNFAVHMKFGV